MSILLYGWITWTMTKRMEKKHDVNCTRMLRAVLNTSWRQHPTKQLLYGHLPPITKIIQISRTRHAGHCWRSKDELINDVLLWTPFTQTSKGWTTSKKPSTAALCRYSLDVAWMTCRGRWTIGTSGKWRSGRSVLAAWHDDDEDDMYIYIYIYIYIYAIC